MELCPHTYEIIETWEGIERSFLFIRKRKHKVYVLQCSKCGDIKQRWVEFPLISKAIRIERRQQ